MGRACRWLLVIAGAFAPSACGHASGQNGGSTNEASCACPPLAPSASAPCDRSACSTPLVCAYQACATTGQTIASCDATAWQVTVTACGPAACPAGSSMMCAAGELCIERQAGDVAYECVPSPCGVGPVTCACAASACEGGTCQSTVGTLVTCEECTSSECP